MLNSLCQKPKSTHRYASTHHVKTAADRENGLVVGGEDGGQEDGQQAGDAQHDAVEELAVAALLLVLQAVPEVDAREAVRRQLGDVGDGLARLQRDAEHVGTVALDALGNVADRMRDFLDAPCVEVGPHDAGPRHVVAVDSEPALDRLVGGIAKREREPGRICAGRGCARRQALGDAVAAGRRFDGDLVALRLVELPSPPARKCRDDRYRW